MPELAPVTARLALQLTILELALYVFFAAFCQPVCVKRLRPKRSDCVS